MARYRSRPPNATADDQGRFSLTSLAGGASYTFEVRGRWFMPLAPSGGAYPVLPLGRDVHVTRARTRRETSVLVLVLVLVLMLGATLNAEGGIAVAWRADRVARRNAIAALLVSSLASGCSDDTDLPPICDGSSHLRFGVKVGVSNVGPGEMLLYDNGAGYLFVSGSCEYHAFWGQNQWAEVRTGRLTPEAELELRRTVRYGAWEGLEGSWPRVPSGIDGASLGFFDETQVIGCSANCDGSTPAALQRMYREVPRIADRLWQDGTVATGPMRITLLRFTEPPIYRVPLATWSLSIPMSDLARADNDVSLYGFGQGVLLDGESDVATIRQLRAEYRDGVHGDFYWRYLPFRDDEEAGPPEYGLWARDVSPFEDERGLVPGPSP